jgi:phenylalanyl-tRNA synthetase beta chain
MKFTLSWLKDHLETDAPLGLIAETLTRIGLEVEGIEDRSAALAPFVVGEVLTAIRHPNADKLQVCTVAIGADQPVEVVCGAPNARAGLKTAFAPVGSVIPVSGDVLKAGAIRGIVSNGMLCSARELKLGENHDGIIELPADAPVGTPIAPVLGLDDPVIEINLTPNRADCAGVRGVARDLAAAGLGALKPLVIEPVPGVFEAKGKIVVEDFEACPLFLARAITNVRNGPSPAWLQARLTAIGLRPISALVDITNYFTFDRNRPLHVFDTPKIRGARLTVRPAREGESFVALNGKTYALSAGMTVIADDEGVESVAGIMGAARTGVDAETRHVVLECALFDPRRTAATGRALQINSDARYRFERGVDPGAAYDGIEAATRMIMDLCGGEPTHVIVSGEEPDWRRDIAFRPARVAALGGVGVPPARQQEILTALGCGVAPSGPDFIVQPPSWRADIAGEADLVEEILRIEGFDRIPEIPLPRLTAVPRPAVDARQRRNLSAKRVLAARGLDEAVTWSFMDARIAALFGVEDGLELLNPISADLSTMRPSILPNLLQAAARNAARGMGDVALFEVGPVFGTGGALDQSAVAAGIRTGRRADRRWDGKAQAVDAFTAKEDALALLTALGVDGAKVAVDPKPPAWLHPGQAGLLRLGPQILGAFGTLHPDVLEAIGLDGPAVGFEIDLDAVPTPRRKGTERPILTLSPFQPVRRDFAFVVDEATAADRLIRAVRGADRGLIVDAALFDVYTGPGIGAGLKSLAIEVTLQPIDKTLTDADIDAVAQRIVAAAAKETGATLRG